MHSLTRIRAAGCSIMLASAGVLATPLTASAQGDAAAGEKIFAHCAACHSNKPGENKFGPSLAGVFGRKSGTGAKLDQKAPIADGQELSNFDAIIFGTPTRSAMEAQMRNFLDQTGGLWMKRPLMGKVGSVFTSTGWQHGGRDNVSASRAFSRPKRQE